MKTKEFFTNLYILVVISIWLLTSSLIIFYINWAFAGIVLIGAVCFFLYITAVYRFVLYKDNSRFSRREDELFMSLWYAWPVYVLLSILIFLLGDELWALAYASGGAAGILAAEFRQISQKKKIEQAQEKSEAE